MALDQSPRQQDSMDADDDYEDNDLRCPFCSAPLDEGQVVCDNCDSDVRDI